MAKTDRDADLRRVELIFEAALERRKAMLAGDYTKLREDLFCDIDDRDGLGIVPIGREALRELDKLSVAAIAAAGLSGRIAIITARAALGPILVRRVIRERQPVSRKMLDQAYRETEEVIRPVLITRTFLLPCHIVDNDEPDEIVIGPVSFLNRRFARRLFRETVKRGKADRADFEDSDRRLLTQALDYYRKFRWAALVTIENCDPKLSEEYALATTTLALSALQSLLGARASQSMSVAGDPLGWSLTARLKLTPAGTPDISVTTAYKGGANFEKGWSIDLQHPGMQIGLRLMGLALEASLPGTNRPLSSRYLGALQWYGEAVRETNAATRFVKFITAVEHLLLTGESDGITGTLARRFAALVYVAGSIESRRSEEAEFKRLYNLRSRFVHGELPPWDDAAKLELRAAADLAEKVLHAALNACRDEGLLSENAKPKRMRKWFYEIVCIMVEATEPADHFATWRKWRRASDSS